MSLKNSIKKLDDATKEELVALLRWISWVNSECRIKDLDYILHLNLIREKKIEFTNVPMVTMGKFQEDHSK